MKTNVSLIIKTVQEIELPDGFESNGRLQEVGKRIGGGMVAAASIVAAGVCFSRKPFVRHAIEAQKHESQHPQDKDHTAVI